MLLIQWPSLEVSFLTRDPNKQRTKARKKEGKEGKTKNEKSTIIISIITVDKT
jgi:hypothetical protein